MFWRNIESRIFVGNAFFLSEAHQRRFLWEVEFFRPQMDYEVVPVRGTGDTLILRRNRGGPLLGIKNHRSGRNRSGIPRKTLGSGINFNELVAMSTGKKADHSTTTCLFVTRLLRVSVIIIAGLVAFVVAWL